MFKSTAFNTLVTTTMTSDGENRKKLAYRMFTCKFPISSLQCHDLLTLWCMKQEIYMCVQNCTDCKYKGLTQS